MNRITQIVVAVAVLLIVAGGSFYGGMLFGKAQAQTAAQVGGRFAGGTQGNGPANLPGQPGQGQRGGGVFGTVAQTGDGFIVITDSNGAQTKITLTDTTLIEKNASVKLSDIAQGETVMVSGSQASDGTYTARSIQVAPAGRFGPPGATTP